MKIVTAAVIEKDGKILIAKRKKGSYLENKWEFPGGKLEPNETPEQCLKRELLEEFNIKTEIGEFIDSSIFEYEHIKIKLLAYRAFYISGDFKLNAHDEIRLIFPSEFDNYDFAEADKPIVKKLKGEL